MKYDNNKPDISLIPPEPLLEIAGVFEYGAKKYARNNWRNDLDNTSYCRTYSSIQRHLLAWLDKIDEDPESGKSHLAHAATQILILMMQTYHSPPEMDDRYEYKITEQDTR